MKSRRNGYVITAVAVALAAICGAAYLLKVPPFAEETGDIAAGAVCDSLGLASQAADALESVLPAETSYAFNDEVHLRVDDQDDSYRSYCSVSGDGDQLMSVRTEMMRDEPLKSWIDSEVAEFASREQLTPFTANDKSAASPSVAAIFMPCASPGKIPGGQYNISVVVHLEKAGKVSDADRRATLIELATSTATYAYGKAKCDASSELSP
ncbi:hypothetical protein ACIGO6_30375 [Streptomyces sp. NPDC053750]|uniref:hypothetical protein n=1 Tax=Streptomyces sp. NPDC053750 TaxID=3365714 RepID=UPI0037CDE4E7